MLNSAVVAPMLLVLSVVSLPASAFAPPGESREERAARMAAERELMRFERQNPLDNRIAREELVAMGEPALLLLLDLVRPDPSRDLRGTTFDKGIVKRLNAILVLAHAGDDRSVQVLLDVLRNRFDHYGARVYAALALGARGASEAEEPLLSILRGETIEEDESGASRTRNEPSVARTPRYLRRAAAIALGRLQSRRAATLLAEVGAREKDREDHDVLLQAACWLGLAELGDRLDREALGRLVDAAEEHRKRARASGSATDDARVQHEIAFRAALLALARCAEVQHQTSPALDAFHSSEQSAMHVREEALLCLGFAAARSEQAREDRLRQLREALALDREDDKEANRLRGMAGIGILAVDPEAVDAIEALAAIANDRHENEVTRAAAALGLGGAQHARAVELLVELLSDNRTNPLLQACAVNAAGRIGDPAFLDLLLGREGIAHNEALVRAEAAFQLWGFEIDARSVRRLAALADDRDKAVQRAAAIALDRHAGDDAEGKLRRLLGVRGERPEEIELRIQAALSVGGGLFEGLRGEIEALRDRDPSAAVRAAAALAVDALDNGKPSDALAFRLWERRLHLEGTPWGEWQRIRTRVLHQVLQLTAYDTTDGSGVQYHAHEYRGETYLIERTVDFIRGILGPHRTDFTVPAPNVEFGHDVVQAHLALHHGGHPAVRFGGDDPRSDLRTWLGDHPYFPTHPDSPPTPEPGGNAAPEGGDPPPENGGGGEE